MGESLLGDSRLPDRFWSKVRVEDGGCWQWTAALNPDGYGRIRLRRDWSPLAHRALWELLIGPVTYPEELDHLCKNRGCVNPQHLEKVQHAENVRRGRGGENWAEKTHCPQGHPYDDQNTRRYKGSRVCRKCSTDRARAYRLSDPEKHRDAVRRSRARRKTET